MGPLLGLGEFQSKNVNSKMIVILAGRVEQRWPWNWSPYIFVIFGPFHRSCHHGRT